MILRVKLKYIIGDLIKLYDLRTKQLVYQETKTKQIHSVNSYKRSSKCTNFRESNSSTFCIRNQRKTQKTTLHHRWIEATNLKPSKLTND
jgi:hypothetical protein